MDVNSISYDEECVRIDLEGDGDGRTRKDIVVGRLDLLACRNVTDS